MANLTLKTEKVSTLTIETKSVTLGFEIKKVQLTLSNSGTKGQTGLTGEKGDKGDVGITGDQGDKGDTGEKGDKGDTGQAIWGTFTGTLSDQTDLQAKLDSKQFITDYSVISKAGNTTKVFSKTGNLVTGIAYDDFEGATNHATVYTWGSIGGKNAVLSRVEVFDYQSQLWTYTSTFTYPTNDAGEPTITPTITKV